MIQDAGPVRKGRPCSFPGRVVFQTTAERGGPSPRERRPTSFSRGLQNRASRDGSGRRHRRGSLESLRAFAQVRSSWGKRRRVRFSGPVIPHVGRGTSWLVTSRTPFGNRRENNRSAEADPTGDKRCACETAERLPRSTAERARVLRGHLHRLEFAAQDWRRWGPRAIVRARGVDPAEVGGELQVALASRSARLGYLPIRPGLHLAAGDEQRGGGAVVGALAGVLLHPAAELAEGHRQHPLGRGRACPGR